MAQKAKRVLAGRYEIESAIGQGGMAKVFRANDNVLGRTVAVKVLAPQFAQDEQFVQRFRREAQAAAGLNHPNVVSVFDTGSENGVHYIVMELVEGRALKDVIQQEGPLHPNRAAEIAEAVCRALAAAHQQGLVHRDVKPGNIMLTSHGEVKVMDFGIARATTGEALTQTATVLGTASYFSPEQAKGEPVDARSDIYSVGCVLYEMLTSRPPFTGDSPVSIAYKHVREDPKLASSHNPDVPGPMESVVMKALAKNPDNRYQSAREMGEDLQRLQRGMAVTATPILPGGETTQVVQQPVHEGTAVMPPVDEEEEEPEKKKWPIVLATLLILALLGIAAFFLIRELTATGPMVEVPNVVGLPEEEARDELEAALFEVTITEENNEEEEGIVFAQDPEGETQAEEGSVVEIFVSLGPDTVEVPDVRGRTEDGARAELEAAGLRLGSIDFEPSDTVEEGRVISQRPAPGREVPTGRAVNIVISSGRGTAFVPNVRCRPMNEARQLIRNQGLEFNRAGQEFSDACSQGTAARTDPEAGSEVPVGSTVNVWESRGASPSPSPSPIVSP